MMSITGDDFEVRYNADKPELLEFVDLNTQTTLELTIDEAFTYLQLILEHRSELQHIRQGTAL